MNKKKLLIFSLLLPISSFFIYCFATKVTYTKITNNSSYTLNITSIVKKNKKLKSITTNLASKQQVTLSTPKRIVTLTINQG